MLVLLGSGEFTDAMLETDTYLLKKLKSNPNIAIVPTAASNEHDYHKWITLGEKHFAKLGINAYGVHITSPSHARDKKHLELLQKADWIYFSGGDPGHLLSIVQGSRVERLINKKLANPDFILAGCSAGAMLMGAYLPANIFAMLKSNVEAKWVPALELVPFTIVPHYDHVVKKETELLNRLLIGLPEAAKQNLIGIDENTALIIDGNKQKVMGRGKVHRL